MAHVFWSKVGEDHKYYLSNCRLVSGKKEFGGMGVPNLRDFDMAMLASWNRRYFDNRPDDWKTLLDYIYKYSNTSLNLLWTIIEVGSPFWRGLNWALSAAKPFY